VCTRNLGRRLDTRASEHPSHPHRQDHGAHRAATSRALCEHFDLTLDQFNQKLGRSDAVPTARWSEYPWLPCYYAAKVDGVEYRLRLGGLVEVAGADGHVREYRHWQD
jgi:hypothetical protein